jgi:large subunit ribosomal protein L24
MKTKFSTTWTASKQPRKQRKYRANAPLHLRRKMMSVSLSKELKKKHEKRNFPVRKGDMVSIMRGEFKGKSGKVDNVDLKKLRIEIDGIYRTKKDGSKTNVYFAPSNLQIKELDLNDQKRKIAIERKETKKSKKSLEKSNEGTKGKSSGSEKVDAENKNKGANK